MFGGIIEIDVHGFQTEAAMKQISAVVSQAPKSVYRIRVIHGYHGGTRIRSEIREYFSYGREDKVKRIEMGTNPGITELIMREF